MDSHIDELLADGLRILIPFVVIVTAAAAAVSRCCTAAFSGAAEAERGREMEAIGIDGATLRSYPKVRYSQAKKLRDTSAGGGGGGATASRCSICLVDYKNGDVLLALPECRHLFHEWCVEPWLRQRPTCPLCRTPTSTG